MVIIQRENYITNCTQLNRSFINAMLEQCLGTYNIPEVINSVVILDTVLTM